MTVAASAIASVVMLKRCISVHEGGRKRLDARVYQRPVQSAIIGSKPTFLGQRSVWLGHLILPQYEWLYKLKTLHLVGLS